MTKIYKIVFDTNRDNDLVYDAFLRKFEGSDKIRYYFLDPEMYGLNLIPDTLYFDADFRMLAKYDFPYTDCGVFIVSLRVKRIIEKFTDFEFHEVNVVMFDESYLEERFDTNGNINKSTPVNEEFMALRFPKLISYFDYENSIYRVPSYNPKGVRGIKKLVLTEKENKFPAIFSTREQATSIFVREDLKIALESERLNGVSFEEVQTTC